MVLARDVKIKCLTPGETHNFKNVAGAVLKFASFH